MSPTIRNDPSRPSGGHALLEGPGLAGVVAVTVENVSSGLFLSAGGRWAKLPHPFPVEPEGDALRLGPAVVDHVPEELLVALRSGDGRDLGRLFWLDVMPSRGRTIVGSAPQAPIPQAPAALPDETSASRPPPSLAVPPPEAAPEPPPAPVVAIEPAVVRRTLPRGALAGAALVALLAAGGAWALLRRPAATSPLPPPRDAALHCAHEFGSKAAAARGGSDDDRVHAAEAALAGGCGAQAFAALDGADWEMSEAAAWHLARFYDPNETDPSVRAAASPHPDWAAAYYARWAPHVPREAAALRQLCTTDAAALDANAQLKRACGR